MNRNAGGAAGDAEELVLAVAFYRGASLAVYMHGVAVELLALVAASVAKTRGPVRNPFGSDETAAIYWEMLAEASMRLGRDVKVRLTTIVGASVGGLVAIALGKALSRNRTLGSVRQIWLADADLDGLVSGPRGVPMPLRLIALAARWLAARRLVAPLSTEVLSRISHAAMEGIDASPAQVPGIESLIAEQDGLALLIPVTDLGSNPARPNLASLRTDRARRLARFEHRADLVPANNHVLAFTAAATAAYPGVFAPLTASAYCDLFEPGSTPRALVGAHAARLAGVLAADQVAFSDGAVHDHSPLSAAIAALDEIEARPRLRRCLVYVDPDADQPGQSDLPRKRPIMSDLAALGRREAARSPIEVWRVSPGDVAHLGRNRGRLRGARFAPFGAGSSRSGIAAVRQSAASPSRRTSAAIP